MTVFVFWGFSRTDTLRVIWRLPAFTGGGRPNTYEYRIFACMGRTTDAMQVSWKTSPHKSFRPDRDSNPRGEGKSDNKPRVTILYMIDLFIDLVSTTSEPLKQVNATFNVL